MIAPLQPFHKYGEPLGCQHLGVQYFGLQSFICPLVHALWPIVEQRCDAGLATEAHAGLVGSPQSAIVTIFTL
jgi:hypothetical protein